MSSSWNRWRIPVLLVTAQVVVTAALMALFSALDDQPPTAAEPGARPSPHAPAHPLTAVTHGSPAHTRAAPPAPSAPTPPTVSPIWPEPDPLPGISAMTDPNFGDPFESDARRGAAVRELARVGAIRLGVTYDSAVHDEQAVTRALRELGAELDAAERGRTDSFERRVIEYQPLVDRYRDRLRPHMDGAFAMKGEGWTDTEEVGLPGPRLRGGGHVH